MTPELNSLLNRLEDLEKVLCEKIMETPGSDVPEGSRWIQLQLSKTLADQFAVALRDARVLLDDGK